MSGKHVRRGYDVVPALVSDLDGASSRAQWCRAVYERLDVVVAPAPWEEQLDQGRQRRDLLWTYLTWLVEVGEVKKKELRVVRSLLFELAAAKAEQSPLLWTPRLGWFEDWTAGLTRAVAVYVTTYMSGPAGGVSRQAYVELREELRYQGRIFGKLARAPDRSYTPEA